MSKSEDGCSQVMKHKIQDAMDYKLALYDQTRSISHTYLNKRECSVQECVFHILSGQWLRKTYPRVIFANSNIPEKQLQMCLSKDEICSLPDHSTNVFQQNMLDT